jgi:hypothetical protein
LWVFSAFPGKCKDTAIKRVMPTYLYYAERRPSWEGDSTSFMEPAGSSQRSQEPVSDFHPHPPSPQHVSKIRFNIQPFMSGSFLGRDETLHKHRTRKYWYKHLINKPRQKEAPRKRLSIITLGKFSDSLSTESGGEYVCSLTIGMQRTSAVGPSCGGAHLFILMVLFPKPQDG